ncbi:WD repeat-containing protein 35 [Planococcus citri]|uniref:WD repeat-containing protein 35 n=1 Tax=Planococcus citri TaxID=170843 RepID=UPI0031F917BC
MFIYLSKKIAIPNNLKVNCVQWSSENGCIAAGGEDGLLKIMKLDSEKTKNAGGTSMNQNLEGHSGNVQIVAWNEQYQKLTSSDDNGLIIVWVLHKGTWYEEMINNRNKSVVKGVAWNYDGQKVCIAYEDGAVIVGSVDGSRIWGKELKKLGLTAVQWSPNSKYILFGTRNGELHLYDDEGVFTTKIKVCCLPAVHVIIHIAAIHWYNGRNGYVEENCPVLAIVYQSGHMQLMKNQHDEKPIILDIGMYVSSCRWNHDGSILAVTGSTILVGEAKETNIVQFFSPYGEHIRTLKLPGSQVSDCSWEGSSLKIALAVDTFVFFANIRPNYSWCYFSNTVVFPVKNHLKNETVVTFWDTKNNECNQKIVKSLLSLDAHKDHCVMAIETETSSAQYMLMVCNVLTTVIDCKFMDLKPIWVCINSTHIFAASQENFIVWHYITPKSRSSMFKLGNASHKKERLYHIDDTPSGVAEVIQDLDKNFEFSSRSQPTKDPICCMTCSNKTLLIGRRSGTIQRYTLPQVALIQRFALSTRPQSIAINCNSTKFSVIDCTGALSLINLHKDIPDKYGVSKEDGGVQIDRRDVWDMKWASDNPQYLAIMERNRMYVLKDGLPEEPINSSAYIADFENLEIKGVLLDEVITSADKLSPESVINFETKSLRDTRELLQKIGIQEATAFIEKNPHPRLWRLLAEAALQNLDLTTAEMAYVRCNDYGGIQLIKKLSNIQNVQLKKATIAAYFGKFDEAEELYLMADRRDLAIEQREKLGDWFKVIELMRTASVSSDSQMTKAWNNIGDYFLERNKLEAAKEYYLKASNYEKLIVCYQYLEDYDSLESCVSMLPEQSPLLKKIGEIFMNVGMCSQSVNAYLKCDAVQTAAEVCVKLNEWDRALQLANQYKTNVQILQMFEKHVHQLLQKGKTLDTIQLYRKAERYLEAAELLFDLANDQSKKYPPALMKKMYVLVGLLVEDYLKHAKVKSKSEGSRAKTIGGIDVDSIRSIKLLDNPWYYAEAYHLLMLSQLQMMNGNLDSALKIAVRLRNYDDILDPIQIYSIITTSAICCKAFDTASKAFIELEAIPSERQKEYELMALNLFSKNEPKDPTDKFSRCSNCSRVNSLWDSKCEGCNVQGMVCMATGQIIENISDGWQCTVCKHFTLFAQMVSMKTCPLCHSPSKL